MKNSLSWLSNKRLLENLTFLVFIILLGTFKFSFHELWKDEFQAWQIATKTSTFSEMFQVLPYEGHPSFWYLLLRLGNIILPFGDAAFKLQLIHFTVAIPAFYLFFTRIRIPLLAKVLMSLSYFTFFEYGVVNRGYILFFLLLCILFIAISENRKWLILVSAFLLCQTEVFGVFISFVLGIFLVYEKHHSKRFFIAYGVVLFITSLLFLFTVIPAGNSEIHQVTLSQFHQVSFYNVVLAFQDLFGYSFYPSLTSERLITSGGLILAMLLFSSLCLLFKDRRGLLYSYLLFAILMVLFCGIIYEGGMRQWGILFITTILFTSLINWERKDLKKKSILLVLPLLSLIILLFYNVSIVNKDKNYLYSNAINAGTFIENNVPNDAVILAINKAYCTPVIGYCGRSFYSLPSNETFNFFRVKERMYIPPMKNIESFHLRMGKELFVISYKALNLKFYPRLVPVQNFDKKSIREENYYLYKLI